MKLQLGLGAIFLLATVTPALAYIDPVTTSIVLQAVIGGFAAFLVAFRRFRDRVFGIFRSKPAVETKPEHKDQDA